MPVSSRPAGEALGLVMGALKRFEMHPGLLKPHFAYGELTRAQYAAAHLMHVEDHLLEVGAS